MKKLIIVAGATGNLGNRIVRELMKRGATVRALVRASGDPEKLKSLQEMGAEIHEVDFDSVDAIAEASIGAVCVVSSLAGLSDVIVDMQKRLLDGAIQAGVPRFIPSDFCTDYNDLVPGENRNFDLRRTFKEYIDSTSIKASSIFNGAFSDILRYNTPVLNLKDKSIGYFGDKADWKLDFTTMDDTAAFTAEVALDDNAPRDLQIASFQVSANNIAKDVKEASGQEFPVRRLSGMEEFLQSLKTQRAQDPAGENQLYAKWQQAQYLYSMFSTHHEELDNGRYANLMWMTSVEFIKTLFR